MQEVVVSEASKVSFSQGLMITWMGVFSLSLFLFLSIGSVQQFPSHSSPPLSILPFSLFWLYPFCLDLFFYFRERCRNLFTASVTYRTHSSSDSNSCSLSLFSVVFRIRRNESVALCWISWQASKQVFWMGSMFKWKVSSLTSRGNGSGGSKKADKLLNNNAQPAAQQPPTTDKNKNVDPRWVQIVVTEKPVGFPTKCNFVNGGRIRCAQKIFFGHD